MTNRRLAVTRRSAAFSSPRCTRRAKRRSSAGSLMSGSFWMSCRYWSKAPEGLARKNAFALPPFDRAIARAPTWTGEGSSGNPRTAPNIGIVRQWCKSIHFSTSQIVRLLHRCDVCPLSTSHVEKWMLMGGCLFPPPDVETCTPVWEVVERYVIMSGSDGRPSTSPNPASIVPVPCRLGGLHEQPHHRRDLHCGRALGPARTRGHE